MNHHAAVRRPATYQDVLDAPPGMVAELVHGALHLRPRPRPRHSRALTSLGGELYGPFDRGRGGPGGWVILDEPELHLGPDVLVPDLAGWRRARLPRLPEEVGIETPPDWICEVLSPATRRHDLGATREIYARDGVAFAWFVDPDAKLLEAFRLADGLWTLIGVAEGEEEARLAPFDAVGFPLGALWPEEPEG